MIIVRSEEEIELLRENNLLVSKTLAELARNIKPGITTLQLDEIAETFIRDHGAEPGFLGYHGFPNSLCTSVNDQVVHGIPSNYELQDGDIISIDCGTKKDGYYGDTAYTFAVGDVNNETLKLLEITKESLYKGVEQAIDGNRVGNIGYTVQKICENVGFSVVRELVGHGLGKNMHEAPEVPNYGKRGSGSLLKSGNVICIEPMINQGKRNITIDKDGWTVRTKDGKPSAHYELAVVVRKDKPEILSTFKFIEEVLEKK